MSIVDFVPRFFSPERELKPTIRYVRDEPPAPPPRPAPPAAPPQTLEQAQAALDVLQAASAMVREKIAQNPDMPRGHEVFSDTAAKRIRAHRGRDIETALDEARRGEPLSILQCGDLWRAHSALTDPGPYHEEPGACEMQASIVARLHERQLLDAYAEALPDLRKLDVAFIKTLLKARDLWDARVAAASKLRRPPYTPAHPQLRTIGDQVSLLIRQLRGIQTPEELL